MENSDSTHLKIRSDYMSFDPTFFLDRKFSIIHDDDHVNHSLDLISEEEAHCSSLSSSALPKDWRSFNALIASWILLCICSIFNPIRWIRTKAQGWKMHLFVTVSLPKIETYESITFSISRVSFLISSLWILRSSLHFLIDESPFLSHSSFGTLCKYLSLVRRQQTWSLTLLKKLISSTIDEPISCTKKATIDSTISSIIIDHKFGRSENINCFDLILRSIRIDAVFRSADDEIRWCKINQIFILHQNYISKSKAKWNQSSARWDSWDWENWLGEMNSEMKITESSP